MDPPRRSPNFAETLKGQHERPVAEMPLQGSWQ
jgi:hypothetical protein